MSAGISTTLPPSRVRPAWFWTCGRRSISPTAIWTAWLLFWRKWAVTRTSWQPSTDTRPWRRAQEVPGELESQRAAEIAAWSPWPVPNTFNLQNKSTWKVTSQGKRKSLYDSWYSCLFFYSSNQFLRKRDFCCPNTGPPASPRCHVIRTERGSGSQAWWWKQTLYEYVLENAFIYTFLSYLVLFFSLLSLRHPVDRACNYTSSLLYIQQTVKFNSVIMIIILWLCFHFIINCVLLHSDLYVIKI